MKVPDHVHKKLKDKLWAIADDANWLSMSDADKSRTYQAWLEDESVGGVLSRYLRHDSARVYIKDTLMKPYARERTKDFEPIRRALNIPADDIVVREYIKPHGRHLKRSGVVCWGRARDWKAVVLAEFERTYARAEIPMHGVVLTQAYGKFAQPSFRGMVEELSSRLGIPTILWLE